MQCNISTGLFNVRYRGLTTPYKTLVLLLGLFFTTGAFALDPPSNIRIEGGQLSWDEVPGANEYHLYYFDEPIPSSTVLGNYVRLTSGTTWPLDLFNDPFGYYTVVAIKTAISDLGEPVIVEYSKVTDGGIVAYLDTTEPPSASALLLSTGQVQSYFPGDDGDKQAGAKADTEQRYIVNGDGTFSDTLTNLVWVAESNCIPLVNWVGALNYANALSGDATGSCATLFDGSAPGDWRLANIVELQSLYDYSPLGVAILNVPVTNLDIVRNQFWSSTSYGTAPSPNDLGLAWEIDFLPGPTTGSHVEQKQEPGRAWAVRDK